MTEEVETQRTPIQTIATAHQTMAYTTGTPWKGVGTDVNPGMTSEEALQLAGLDWEVETRKIRLVDGPQVPKFRAKVRKTDGKVLGVGTERYTPIQNHEAFDFLDSLVADEAITYETAGSLQEGRRVWMLARLNEDYKVGDDDFTPYMLGVTGHDWNFGFKVFPTTVRVICQNTLQLALQTRGGIAVEMNHAGDVKLKLERAREVLTITTEAQRRYMKWFEQLQTMPIGERQLATVKMAIIGEVTDESRKQRKEADELFGQIYKIEHDAGYGDTAYTLFNAVTGYADHRPLRERADHAERMVQFLGTGQSMKARGIAVIEEVTGYKVADVSLN